MLENALNSVKRHKFAISIPAAGSPQDISSCCPSCQLPAPTVPWLPRLLSTKTNHLFQRDRWQTQRGWKMLSSRNRFSAPMVTPERPFPLGPFPRHIWIHSNTPQDGLDETCHEIWKRVQRLSEELEPPALVSPLPPALCPEPMGTLCTDSTDPLST